MGPKVTTKETTNVFSPTLIPSMADKKSRKRKFKNRISSSEKSKPDEKSLKPKASKEQKQNLRRLFRNRQRNPVETKMEPKNKETSKDTVQQNTTEIPKITIEEKSNPRKIIFRKSFNGKTSRRLANGRLMLRKKKEKDGRKDPLVESLLSQIKRQKLKHRSFRRNRTGGAKRPLPAILNRPKTLPDTENPETAAPLDQSHGDTTKLPETKELGAKEEEVNAMPIAKMDTTGLPPTVGWTVPSTRVQNEEATGSDLQEPGFPTVIPNQLHLTTEPSTSLGLLTTIMPFEAPKVTTVEPLG